jgi:hypothetical protein
MLALFHVVRHIIDREDVHIDTNFESLSFVLNHASTQVYNLGKGIIIMWFLCRIQQFILLIALKLSKEPLVVLARHIDVDIVIPGYIALMAHSTYQRPTGQEIVQAMSLTVLMHLVKDAHLDLAQLVYVCNLSHSL